MRGIFQAVFLREVQNLLGAPLREKFDLIGGTSTGAVVALGVALGIDLARVVSLFEQQGPDIFPAAKMRSSKKLVSYARRGAIYNPEPLNRVLGDVFTASNGAQYQLRDCQPAVVIPATNLDEYRIRSFSTLVRVGEEPSLDGELFARDVALASAAAPIFFPAHQPRGRTSMEVMRTEERTYIDGGIWANNPVLQSVMTVKRSLDVPFDEMKVISVGNGEIPQGQISTDFQRMRRARMLEPVMNMMFATQSELADKTVGELLGDETFSGERMLRVNAQLDVAIALDDVVVAVQKLKPRAEHAARESIGAIRAFVSG